MNVEEQLSLQFSGFRVKARHLGHPLKRKCLCIKYSNVLDIFRTSDSFYR